MPLTDISCKDDKPNYKNENTFEAIALEWYETEKPSWTQTTAHCIMKLLKTYLFPILATRPIPEITIPEVLSILRRIEEEGNRKITQDVDLICMAIFSYALDKYEPHGSVRKYLWTMIAAIRTYHVADRILKTLGPFRTCPTNNSEV